jgi:hypothetical protein
MKRPYTSETTLDINYAHNDTLRQLAYDYPVTFNSNDELVINPDATRGQVVGLYRFLFNSARSSTMVHNRAIGDGWINAEEVEKYGDRKELLIEAFGGENYKRMLNYFNSRAVVCRRWNGLWKPNRLWEWHRHNYPNSEEEYEVDKTVEREPEDTFKIKAYINGVVETKNKINVSFHSHFGMTVYLPDKKTGQLVRCQIYQSQLVEPILKTVRQQKLQDILALEKSCEKDVIIKRNNPT